MRDVLYGLNGGCPTFGASLFLRLMWDIYSYSFLLFLTGSEIVRLHPRSPTARDRGHPQHDRKPSLGPEPPAGNLERLGITSGFRIHAAAVGAFLRRATSLAPKPERREEAARYEVVFLDPPYDAAEEYAATLGLLGGAAAGLLADGAVVIAEHRRKDVLEDSYGALERTRILKQGDAALSFYAARPMR
jgi:23S rRNA A2030 N6-methylase RlmJ